MGKWFFDLQRFAETGVGAGTGAAGAESGDSAGKSGQGGDAGAQGDAKTYTQADIDAVLTAKLAEEKGKWEKEYQQKAEAAKKEQERLSKLSDDERKKAEFDKAQQELLAKEKELKIKELKLEVVEDLAKRGIPVSFLDYLVVDADSEKTLGRITNFEKEYKKAVDTAVNERLKGKTPRSGGAPAGTKAKTGGGFMEAIRKEQARR